MIGAVVFVIAFVLLTLISMVVSFPPGVWVYDWVPEIQQTQYASLVSGVINGVVYGLIIWIAFSLVKTVYDRRKGKQKLTVEVKAKE